MSLTTRLLVACAATASVASSATAQATPAAPAAPAQVNIITMTTFRVPLGEDRGKVIAYLKKWFVEPAKLNPNVLSYRVLQHQYGSNANDVAIVVEYPNMAAISAPCAPCAAYFEANQPKAGTPERKVVDEEAALFLKYYSGHADQIYSANMSLAKP